MPTPRLPVDCTSLELAKEALPRAREVRQLHRRRRLPSRQIDLSYALQLLDTAHRGVKTIVHSAAWRRIPCEGEARKVSDQIKAERRKLLKMKNRDLQRGKTFL